ncbi:MAG TPA: uracil-DNA glycosylase family protein [Candidatus Saccharimonadales bacterium]|nr:uracil-DNA glycosylase family protein [Candidatus Saccharimonadales bacterium]
MLRQLEVINPKVVVTLGRHSTNCFLPEASISRVHGTVQRSGNDTIMPVFRPAVALYNHSSKQLVVNDFMKLKKYLQEGKYEPKQATARAEQARASTKSAR